MVHNGAANRDPRQFEAPNEFRLDRADGRLHLGFGFGIHTCVGAPLARAEARASLVRLLARMADIKISEREHGPADARRYEYSPTYMLRGLERLNLEFASGSLVTSSIPRSRKRSRCVPFDDLTVDVLPPLRVRFEMPVSDRVERTDREVPGDPAGTGARAPAEGRRRRAAVRVSRSTAAVT